MIRCRIFAALAGLALLAGCGSLDNPPSAPQAQPQARLQVIHAAPDAPSFEVLAANSPVWSAGDYGQASPLLQVPARPVAIEVKARLPGSRTATLIGPVTLGLADKSRYTVVATGRISDLQPVVLSTTDVAPPAGLVRLRLLHAAPAAPTVDVYLTAPTAALAVSTALTRLAFRQDFGPAEVADGSYRIRITPAGNREVVVFDSGPLTLASQSDLTVVAIDNTGPGDAPLQLLVADAKGGTAQVRVVQAPPRWRALR
ncbi:MAG: hypothetical protein RL026_1992 [Pseudomonadota bacterium]